MALAAAARLGEPNLLGTSLPHSLPSEGVAEDLLSWLGNSAQQSLEMGCMCMDWTGAQAPLSISCPSFPPWVHLHGYTTVMILKLNALNVPHSQET